MATIIPVDGLPREVTPANGRHFTLRELQAIVGGYIEALYGYHDGRIMFIDEDGKRDKAPNPDATALMLGVLAPGDVICGDVVLCTLTEAGESEGIEDADLISDEGDE